MPIAPLTPLRLVLSIDVEEEGLFAQEYQCRNPSVSNVAHLTRLLPLIRESGIPLTLFCDHAVFTNVEACRAIAHLRDAYGAEVGAHLHHWNTPPLQDDRPCVHGSAAVSTALVPEARMREKLQSLFAAGEAFQGAPLYSFRMGRWDMRREHWPLLADLGVGADASVRPLHCGYARPTSTVPAPPDHFAAPREPYLVRVEGREIFECPLTTTPLVPGIPHWAACLRASGWPGAGKLRASVQKWGGLTLLPVYQPLWLLKLCTRAHVRAGGRTLSLTWHSSEMMPQGAPHMPSAQSVDAFMHKMRAYVRWLYATWPVEALTLHDLSVQDRALCPVADSRAFSPSVDWTF
ncbi:MAG: glycosyl transferase family 1 [Desulfovibrionaceae bacterium]